MAEVVGLVLGAVGLAGLFNNVLDCFEYIHIGKTFGGNFQTSLLKLDNARLRLSRWGDALGFSGGGVRDATFLPDGIDPEDKDHAEKLLGQILMLFDDVGKETDQFKNDESLLEDAATKKLPLSAKPLHQIMKDFARKRQNSTKLSEKVKFALYQESRVNKLVDDITDLTNDLVTLFPAIAEDQMKLCSDEVGKFTESLKVLAKAVKGHDELLSTALSEVLKPAVSSIRVSSFILSSYSHRVRITFLISETKAMPWGWDK
jgi:hypothetical protein